MEALGRRNQERHPRAVRQPYQPTDTPKERIKKGACFEMAVSRLKLTLLPLMLEDGLHVKESQAGGPRTQEVPPLLVDSSFAIGSHTPTSIA